MNPIPLRVALLLALVACTNKDDKSDETDVEDTDVEDTEVEDTEVEDTEVEDTEVEDTEVEDTELIDTDVFDTDVSDTELIDTELIDTDVIDTEVIDTEVEDTEVVDTDVIDTEVEDTEVEDTDPAELLACTLTASTTTPTTRHLVSFDVEGDDGSGTPLVVTDATFSSDDEDVIKIYNAPAGQPIGPGTATVTATIGPISCSVTLTVTVVPAEEGDVVINEFMTDVEGDQNGDGTVDGVEDEFVEIANVSDQTVDLSGVTLHETDFAALPRHTFADGTILRAGEVIVVFGGGDAASLSVDHASFVVADNLDAGLLWGLNLNDSSDIIRLREPGGLLLAELAYGGSFDAPAGSACSVNLSPEVWGSDYLLHTSLAPAVASPGTQVDGSGFGGPDGRYGL